jgi:hypothetical protein
MGAILLRVSVCLLLTSLPATADVYPVNGVWAAPNANFPVAADESCFAIKLFGVEAIWRKSVSEMMIFTNDKRYDVKGDVQIESTVHTVKAADGGFWITEVPNVRNSFWFRQKATYFLAIINPGTIEIRDSSRLTRFVKCGLRNRSRT